MLEIQSEIISRILANNDIRSWLGSTPDERVLSWETPQDVVYSGQSKGTIFYRVSLNKRGVWSYPKQFHNMLVFFRVVHISELERDFVAEKLIEIFDDNSNNKLETTNYSVKKIDFSNKSTGANEGTPSFPLYVSNISFIFSNIFKK